MDERTAGFVLRTRPCTETSLIVHWLTRDFGRISTIAKGARRPKSPFAGKLDLFYLADLSYYASRRSDLHTLAEVAVRDFCPALRRDLGRFQQACYFAQLIEQSTETGTPLPGLFTLLEETLAAVAAFPPAAMAIHAFEVKLLGELGLNPAMADSGLDAGSREILKRLPEADWTLVFRIRPAEVQAASLNGFLHRFLVSQFGRVPKSRAAALHTCLGAAPGSSQEGPHA